MVQAFLLNRKRTFCKLAIDVFIAMFLILLSIPAIGLVCLIVKMTSSGPLLVTEERLGKDKKRFHCYKFRTTYGVDLNRNGQVTFAYNDPVLTPFGMWLRRLGFDELPQLFNVLKGDMSLIGPRPYKELTSADKEFFLSIGQSHDARYAIRPGITGWAQVNNYRGAAQKPELEKWHLSQRLKHDLYYIENWSICLDIKILLMTMTGFASKRRLFNCKHQHVGGQHA